MEIRKRDTRFLASLYWAPDLEGHVNLGMLGGQVTCETDAGSVKEENDTDGLKGR